MDPALVRDRQAFLKKAMQVPVVEKRKAKHDDKPTKQHKKHKASHKSEPKPKKDFDYKNMSGSSRYKFSILAKIVKHMKQRHQEGEGHPLDIDDILDETNQTDIGIRLKHWLITEALANNPKIDVINGDTYKYKPKHTIKDKKALMRLLDKYDQQGLGGIPMDDVEESLPNVERVLKNLGDQIIYVTRPDKKKVLFYNDKSSGFTVDEEIQKLWRSVTVEGMDERKVEEYLQKQGISSMQDLGIKKAVPQKRKGGRRKTNLKSHNEHLGDILQDYSNVEKK